MDIKNADKKDSEENLTKEVLAELNTLLADKPVMLNLTIPDVDNLYADVRKGANKRLAKQRGMITGFSQTLSEGLRA